MLYKTNTWLKSLLCHLAGKQIGLILQVLGLAYGQPIMAIYINEIENTRSLTSTKQCWMLR